MKIRSVKRGKCSRPSLVGVIKRPAPFIEDFDDGQALAFMLIGTALH
jgi:hypothetical protein